MSKVMSGGMPFEKQLKAIMRSWHLPIEPGCEYHLNELIQKAVKRMQTEGFASDKTKIHEAEENFRKLLTEMTRQAGILGYKELHESTFFNALSKLCPIWPFCF